MHGASWPHLLNLFIHVKAGAIAILLGLYLLAAPKGDAQHRRRGRVFMVLAGVVCLTAVIGNAVFRFMPLFAVLTLLVSYQLASGWHVVHTRAAGPDALDAVLLLCAGGGAGLLVQAILGDPALAGASIALSTLAALACLLAYDAARWAFPRHWHGVLWRYEHIYKLVATLFAMLSAAVGNTVRAGQPWSQLAPTALGLVVILCCWVRTYRQSRSDRMV